MNTRLEVTYRDMGPSPAIEFVIKERLAKLERHFPALQSCRVVVQAPPQRMQKGGEFDVKVELSHPGGTVVAHSNQGHHSDATDCASVVRGAFGTACRELDRFHSKKVSATRHRGSAQ